MSERGPIGGIQMESKQHEKEVVTSNQVVYMISCQGLCTQNE